MRHWERHEHFACNRLWVRPHVARVTNAHPIALAALDRGGNRFGAERGATTCCTSPTIKP